MKATDLMIGDWVNSTIEGKGKVTRIDRDGFIAITYGNQQNAVVCKSYDLIPIPLTTEILQSNGFEFTGVDKTASFPNDARIFAYENEEETVYVSENGVIWWLEIELADYADNIRMAFEYVHQLQHALRLVGIKKEFEI